MKISISFGSAAGCALLIPAILALPPARSAPDPGPPAALAAQKGLDFIQQDAAKWRVEKKCGSCHQGLMTLWTLAEARSQGYPVSAEAVADAAKWTKERLTTLDQPRDPRPGYNVLSTQAVYLALMARAVPKQEAVTPDDLKRISGHLVRYQETAGNWAWSLMAAQNRPPPFFDGDDVLTVMAAAALPSDTPEGRGSREKAAAWLSKTPRSDTTQAAGVRLLAVAWDPQHTERKLNAEIKSLLSRQQPDGGWAPEPGLSSDAYATGQSLYILSLAGVKPNRDDFRRGVQFLVRTQREDGSWSMTPRANPGAKPFTNPSPIIYTASAWATLALLHTNPSTSSSIGKR